MKSKIEQWDGKDVRYLTEIYAATENVSKLVEYSLHLLLETQHTQIAATWLLKKALEDGYKLSNNQVEIIYKNLDRLDTWESKLHILQIMPYMIISAKVKKNVERFLRNNLTDTNKFIRAWTYNGFYELCVAFPEYTDEVKSFFEMAMRDEAPSVKSRIRNIQKTGF